VEGASRNNNEISGLDFLLLATDDSLANARGKSEGLEWE
jgi:hypothetical protein